MLPKIPDKASLAERIWCDKAIMAKTTCVGYEIWDMEYRIRGKSWRVSGVLDDQI